MMLAMGNASPGALWSRSDLRARFVSLVVLGILAGLTIGLATAALDGARRTDSALDRLRARTNASDAVVFATQVNVTDPDWTALSRRPEVEQLVPWGLVFGNLDGDPNGTLFVPMDGKWLEDRRQTGRRPGSDVRSTSVGRSGDHRRSALLR